MNNGLYKQGVPAAQSPDAGKRKGESRVKARERFFQVLFFIASLLSIVSVLLIAFYIFWRGVPAIAEVGLGEFLFGTRWSPKTNDFGILPMITASFYITLGTLVIGVPVGLLTAIYLSRFAGRRAYAVVKPMVELLAGIPSVVYGFFGLVVVVPLIAEFFGGAGNSMLAAILILSVMVLPTIITISDTSIRAVPEHYYEGALALGATHEEAVFKVVVPAARSGILTSVILSAGRAVGETMAVILVAGNSPIMPTSLTASVRSMTANIAMEMSYASGLHQDMLFATGVVLFVFILGIITLLSRITGKEQ